MIGESGFALTGCDSNVGLVVEPVEVRLQRRREQKQREIEDLDKAIAMLQKQPELLETLNLLRKVGI